MQDSFWGIVGIPFQIKTIEKETLSDALLVAYSSNEYLLYSSSWFIDVKGGFRIFSHKGTTYIAKETSENKANLEAANSKKAYEKLNGRVVGTKKIKIIVPQIIKLLFDKERYFLVSEHFSSDMNEHVYTNTRPHISLRECLSIVKLLLENGIEHRGFLPRNIVEKKDTIYLFDWEDAIFRDKTSVDSFDHLWKTNFLLNWSYLFDFDDLEDGLKKFVGLTNPLNEPPLVKYENTFKDIANFATSIQALRNTIDKIVFGSELPLVENSDHFYIRPNDMGHLVADIFPSEIDVLHDILCYLFRKKDENKFCYHSQLATNLLIAYFKSAQNNPHTLSLQYSALIPILMMLDEYISDERYLDILSANTLNELISKIFHSSVDKSITRTFLSGGTKDLSRMLYIAIRKKLKEAFPEINANGQRSVDNIVSFVENESIRDNTGGIL